VKKILKTSFFVFSFLALFYSNAFAFIEFKQSKDISTDTVAVKASDEKNKLNKTKNTFSLRAPFIINFLLFFIKLSILIY
jgi:hypothetical protein